MYPLIRSRVSGAPWFGLLVVIAALALAACGGDNDAEPPAQATPQVTPEAASEASETAFPLTFTDASGIQVTLPAAPRRVIAVLSSVTSLLLDLDLAERIVATDDFSLARDELAGLPSVGGSTFVFNLERSVELEPDLILVAQGHTEDYITQARAVGLLVIEVPFMGSVDAVLAELSALGRLFDIEARADAVVSDLRARLARVAETVAGEDPVSVYLELDQSTPTMPFSVGPGSLHQEVLTLAGARNVFGNTSSAFPQVNWEAVIDADPQVILLLDSKEFADALSVSPISVEEVAARTGWDAISAVRNGRIIPLPVNLFDVGVQVIDAVERVAEILAEARKSSAEDAETGAARRDAA